MLKKKVQGHYLNKINKLKVWENETYKIIYTDKTYSLYKNDKQISNNYSSITHCIEDFFIVCKRTNSAYKYQLLKDDNLILGKDRYFEYINFNKENKKFTLYNYFNKTEISFPTWSQEKNKLFMLFLQKYMDKNIYNEFEIQKIINKFNNKLETLSDENIETILNNLKLTNTLYNKLNKPNYLKDYLIILDKNEEENLLTTIQENKFNIFKELTKDIIKDKKIYELNKDIINDVILNKKSNQLNEILTNLNNIQEKFITELNKYEISRKDLFNSLESIKKYFNSKETIKYFSEEDFEYIKKDTNLFFNIMYNKKNIDILNKLNEYYIN